MKSKKRKIYVNKNKKLKRAQILMKAVFTDLDGTLLTSNDCITPLTIEVFDKLKAQGIECIIATGRIRERALDAANQIKSMRYVITSGGGEVYDRILNKVILKSPIAPDAIRQMYKVVKKYGITLRMNDGETASVNMDNPLVERKILFDDTCFETLVTSNDITSCEILSFNKSDIKNAYEEISKIKNIRITSYPITELTNESNLGLYKMYYIDIIAPEASKGVALKNVSAMLNIEPNECFAFGDGFNDMDMISTGCKFIAIGNAIKEIKERADMICDTNNNEGVAKFLIKHFNLDMGKIIEWRSLIQ